VVLLWKTCDASMLISMLVALKSMSSHGLSTAGDLWLFDYSKNVESLKSIC